MSGTRITPQHVPKRVVPEDYYTCAQIAEYEHISQARIRSLAEQTKEAIIRAAMADGLVDKNGWVQYARLPKYFNTLKDGVCRDKTVNAFLTNPTLEPFAHMFRLFFRRQMAAENDATPVFYGDFGVRMSVYERYKATGKVPDYTGRGKLPKYDVAAREGRSKVVFPDGGRVDLPHNAVYRRFRDGVAACNAGSEEKVTIPEMVIVAMKEFMDARQELFGEQSVEIDENKLSGRSTRRMRVDMDPELADQVGRFLQRYNKTHTPAMSLREFIRIAIRAQLERMPLELVDPKLAAQVNATTKEKKKTNF